MAFICAMKSFFRKAATYLHLRDEIPDHTLCDDTPDQNLQDKILDRNNDRLCVTCTAIFDNPLDATHLRHFRDTASLIEAARVGCYICMGVWRDVKKTCEECQQPDPTTVDIDLKYWLWERDESTFQVEFGHKIYPITHITSFIAFRGDVAQKLSVQARLSSSIHSAQNLQQARVWLDDCQQNHKSCVQSTEKSNLPTRLISVRRDGARITSNLCESISLQLDTPYLSLSHCWGKDKFLTLTTKNIQDFHDAIPISGLPCIFQDALLVTLELGFQYIWIDSLCIVQDDEEDWDRESKKMGQVYKNAVCNLSVSGSASAMDKFLPAQRLNNPTPPTIHPHWKDSKVLPAQKYSGYSYFIANIAPWAELWDAPLYKRAWVLQEQILAPRALHFSREQVFWECKECFASEVHPYGWKDFLLKVHTFEEGLKKEPFWQFCIQDIDTKTHPAYDLWRKIVENYSNRLLTYSSDRLPALSGITSEIHAVIGGEYRFGLWSTDLDSSLLWKQKRPFSSTNIPKRESLIPSWSWASLGGPVKWDSHCFGREWHPRKDKFVKVLKTPSEKALQLAGRLMAFNAKSFISPELDWDPNRHIFNLGDTDEGDTCRFNLEFDQWYADGNKLDQRSSKESRNNFKRVMHGVFFLPLVYGWDPTRNPSWQLTVIGLLLKFKNSGKGVYSRVGMAEMFSSNSHKSYDMSVDMPYYQRGISKRHYQDVDDKGNYTITIF